MEFPLKADMMFGSSGCSFSIFEVGGRLNPNLMGVPRGGRPVKIDFDLKISTSRGGGLLGGNSGGDGAVGCGSCGATTGVSG